VIGLGVFGTASTFPAIAFNDQSRLFVAANLLGSGVNTFNDEALFLENEGGNLTLLAREGDPAPTGQPGVTYGGGVLADFDSLQINALGQIVFTCRLGGSMPTTFAVFTTHTGTLAPLSPPAEAGSSIFGAPILSDAGKLALVVSLPDNEPGYPVTLGIWWDQPGALTPLVRPGDTVAGPSGDLTVTSAGQIVGFSATGLLAFRAYLQGDAEYPQHNLLLADAGCGLHRVIGNGDLFDVAGDGSDLREVLRIVTGGLAANGTVAFRLDFTDNSSGHFSARLALAGDADSDGDIDLSDHAALAACLTGPGAGPPAANCTALDFEPDADIDLRDTAAFFNIFTGP
jgi:hypothetical protein